MVEFRGDQVLNLADFLVLEWWFDIGLKGV
jgi:hypothetical protein